MRHLQGLVSNLDCVGGFDRAAFEAGATPIALLLVDDKSDIVLRDSAVGAFGFASSTHNAFVRIDYVFSRHENNPFDWWVDLISVVKDNTKGGVKSKQNVNDYG